MPTPLTHALIPLVLGHTITDRKLPLRFWLLAVFCSVLPDADVIGFRFGVSYGDFFGHRGFFHSLFFAFLLSSTVMLLAFRKPSIFSKKWRLIWLFFLGVSSSHGILDAFTNGGLGIALLSPFNTTRYFSPWRPFVVAPFRIRELFTPWGKEVLLSELYWIWLPLILAFIIATAYRKIKLMNHNKTRKAECQSVGLAKNVFKRLLIALLVLLLIASLILQAPWKVIALLLIILAACTVLPKPYRKWFWLSVAAIVIALIIWVFLPDRGQWKPYRHNFEKELKSLNDKYAIPDEDNAAVIYNRLLDNYESSEFIPDLADPNIYALACSQQWLGEDHPDLAQWLQGHKRTIATLLEASKIEKCRFNIDEDSLKPVLVPSARLHLRAMQKMAWLLVCAANNDLAEKQNEQALEKQFALLQMSEHLRQQPLAVDMRTGIALQALALSRINSFLVTTNPSEPYLTGLDDIIANIKHDWKVTWAGIAESEKLSVMKDYFWMLYETNAKGKIRITVADFFNYFKPISLRGVPYWNTRRAKAESILTWFLFPCTPKEAAGIIEKTLQKYGDIKNPDSRWAQASQPYPITPLRFNFSYIIDLYVDSYIYSLHDKLMRLKSDKRAARIIIALRRYKNKHGRWPDKLDDIKSLAPAEIFVDPINGGSFVYKLTEENFTLYSKGNNNIDENGQGRYHSIEGADDWLIWPRKTRKTKNGKADTAQSNTQKDVVK